MNAPALRVTDPRTSTARVPRLPGVAVGCDVVEVDRVASLLTRWPGARERLFTPAELADSTRDGVPEDDPAAMRRLAARFAAKEALVKLLGRPAMAWTDVEIVTTEDGAPVVRIHDEPTDIAVSLSHDRGVAMAVVARRTDPRPHDPRPHDPSPLDTPTTPRS